MERDTPSPRLLAVFRFAYGALALYAVFLLGALLLKQDAFVPDMFLGYGAGASRPVERLLRTAFALLFILLPLAAKGVQGWRAAWGFTYVIFVLLLAEDFFLIKKDFTLVSIVAFLVTAVVIAVALYFFDTFFSMPFRLLFSLFSSPAGTWKGGNAIRLTLCMLLIGFSATYYLGKEGVTLENIGVLILLSGFIILVVFRSGLPSKEERYTQEEDYYDEDEQKKHDDYIEWLAEAARAKTATPERTVEKATDRNDEASTAMLNAPDLYNGSNDLRDTVNFGTVLKKRR